MTSWKRDTVVQAWVDRRDLATCALAVKGMGIEIKNPSQLVAYILGNLALQQPEEYQIKTTTQAVEVIDRLYGETSLNPGGKGIGNLKDNLVRDRGTISVEAEASEEEIQRIIRENLKKG